MRVSHETIYKSLYVQGRGELRRELAALPADRAGRNAAGPRPQRAPRGGIREHGHDQRTSRRGRRPGRARPLGRRPDHRQGRQERHRHPGRAHHPLRDAPALVDGQRRRSRPRRDDRRRSDRCPNSCADRSPGTKAREMAHHADVHHRHRHRRSTSATPTAPGSAVPTRTPTACYASTTRIVQRTTGSWGLRPRRRWRCPCRRPRRGRRRRARRRGGAAPSRGGRGCARPRPRPDGRCRPRRRRR